MCICSWVCAIVFVVACVVLQFHLYVYLFAFICSCIYVCACIRVFVFVFVFACVSACVFVYGYMYSGALAAPWLHFEVSGCHSKRLGHLQSRVRGSRLIQQKPGEPGCWIPGSEPGTQNLGAEQVQNLGAAPGADPGRRGQVNLGDEPGCGARRWIWHAEPGCWAGVSPGSAEPGCCGSCSWVLNVVADAGTRVLNLACSEEPGTLNLMGPRFAWLSPAVGCWTQPPASVNLVAGCWSWELGAEPGSSLLNLEAGYPPTRGGLPMVLFLDPKQLRLLPFVWRVSHCFLPLQNFMSMLTGILGFALRSTSFLLNHSLKRQ